MDNQQNQNTQLPESKPVSPPPANPVPQESYQPPIPPPKVTQPPPPITAVQPVQEGSPNKPKTFLYLLVVLVVIVTIISLGIILFNFSKPSEPKISQVTPTPAAVTSQPTITVTAEDQTTQNLSTQGTSDEIADIEKDLNNTDLTNIDKEVNDINSELSQP